MAAGGREVEIDAVFKRNKNPCMSSMDVLKYHSTIFL